MPHDTMITRAPGAYAWPRQPDAPATAPRRADPCADDRPACAACGGLECLCRPRFFPGQLLTDEDLNRLQDYVIGKNRLHNRYLHGWGVACGLEVVCDPCASGGVVVRTGYALSPCGDDIVVCNDTAVDLCRLIQDCRPQGDPVCDPPYRNDPRECRGEDEEWVLAICYDERPTRGITALTGAGDTSHGSRCRCGGSASGNCSCGGATRATLRSTCGCGGTGGSCGCGTQASGTGARRRKKSSPQCEPTQVCEGYRFTAWRVPPAAKGLGRLDRQGDVMKYGAQQDLMFAWLFANRARLGPLLERLMCCVLRALELRATWREGRKYEADGALQAYVDYAEALREFAADFAIHRCKALAEINRLVLQAQNLADGDGQFDAAGAKFNRARMALNQQEIGTRFAALDLAWLSLVLECICSALLPACPEPAPMNCVPLAVLKVSPGDCRVNEICNWRERKLLITWRTVGYWLSWLPWDRLQNWVAKLCCGQARGGAALLPLVIAVGTTLGRLRSGAGDTKPSKYQPGAGATPAAAAPAELFEAATPFDGIAMNSKLDPLQRAFESDDLMSHLAGQFDSLRSGASDAPGWAKLLAGAADGEGLLDLFGALATTGSAAAPSSEIEALRRQLADQQAQIDALRVNR